MMKLIKRRALPFLLVLVVLFSHTTLFTYASSSEFSVNFWDVFKFSRNVDKNYATQTEIELSLFGLDIIAKREVGDYDDGGADEYNAVVEDIQTQVGTPILTSGNELIYYVPYIGYSRDSKHITCWQGEEIDNGIQVIGDYYKISNNYNSQFMTYTYKAVYPITGTYRVESEQKINRTDYTEAGVAYGPYATNSEFVGLNPVYKAKGIVQEFNLKNGGGSSNNYGRVVYTAPSKVPFICVPSDSEEQNKITHTKNDYMTRVGYIDHSYQYIDTSTGDTVTTENTYIVNETDNSVYNPVTNNTYNYTDWNYDYSTRAYNLTLDNSEKMTVTYGDDYMTITENNTVYNVYYYMDGGVTTDPTDPPDEPTDPTDPPDEPTDPTDPPDEPADPPDEPTDPIDPPDEPTDPPDEPTDPIDPPDEPTDPTDPPDEPTDPDDEDGGSLWDIIVGILGKLVETITSLVLPLIRAIVDGISKIFNIIGEGLSSVVDLIINAMLELPRLF